MLSNPLLPVVSTQINVGHGMYVHWFGASSGCLASEERRKVLVTYTLRHSALSLAHYPSLLQPLRIAVHNAPCKRGVLQYLT